MIVMLRAFALPLALAGLLMAAASQPAHAAKTCTTLSAWAVGVSPANATNMAERFLKWKINNWAGTQKVTTIYTRKTDTSCGTGPLPRCTSTAEVCV